MDLGGLDHLVANAGGTVGGGNLTNADAVAFLLSARASWITGANIVVDGGQRYPSARRFD